MALSKTSCISATSSPLRTIPPAELRGWKKRTTGSKREGEIAVPETVGSSGITAEREAFLQRAPGWGLASPAGFGEGLLSFSQGSGQGGLENTGTGQSPLKAVPAATGMQERAGSQRLTGSCSDPDTTLL